MSTIQERDGFQPLLEQFTFSKSDMPIKIFTGPHGLIEDSYSVKQFRSEETRAHQRLQKQWRRLLTNLTAIKTNILHLTPIVIK